MSTIRLRWLLPLSALLLVFGATSQASAEDLSDLLDRMAAVEIVTHAEAEYKRSGEAYRRILDSAEALLFEDLSKDDLLDIKLLAAQARRRLFEIEELELHRLSPGRYLSLSTTNSLFVRPCAQPDGVIERAASEIERLAEVIDNGRKNLTRPARTWAENAIVNSRYAEMMLGEMLADVCVEDEALKKRLVESGAEAAREVAAYRDWMQSELLARSTRAPTWSPEEVEVYQFEHEFLEDYGVDEMLRIAANDEAETLEQMEDLAKRIHPSGDLETVWNLMKDEAPPWEEVPAMAQRYVDLADDWLRGPGSHLIQIPERFDYGVQITAPMGRRTLSFGGASYGPTLGGRISGYYVLTPLEPWLSDADKASRIRSYNPYWTHVISYHEWLGHNVQRAIASEFAERPMRKRFSSIYLSQAWSFYLEKLLEDEGYFEDVLPHMEALKTRMARLQMRMWRVQRILTKLRMSKDEMTFDEAVQAYISKIGMEQSNAFIEVQRDSQSPSPPGREIIGERIILEMREEYRKRLGEHFTLRGFHEALLRYGDLPLPVVRDLMFGDI